MYAIVRTGGKQYRVQAGDRLRIEKLEADLGTELDLTEVLAIGGDKLIVGEPTVQDAKVTVVVTNQRKSPRVIIFKKKRRQGYRRLTGHSQLYTEVFVKSISSPSGTVTAQDKPLVFDVERKADRDQRKADYARKARLEGQKTSGEEESASAAPVKAKALKKSAKAAPKKAKGGGAKKAKGAKSAAKTTKKSTVKKKTGK
jgi:large subunit ribosomal protein L21